MKTSLIWFCALLFIPAWASGDESAVKVEATLHLTDGTTIKGSFLGYRDGHFVIRPATPGKSGEDRIPQDKVAKITFENRGMPGKGKPSSAPPPPGPATQPGAANDRRISRFKLPEVEAMLSRLGEIFDLQSHELRPTIPDALQKPKERYEALCDRIKTLDDPRHGVGPIWALRPFAERRGEPERPIQILKERLSRAKRGTQEYITAKILLGIATIRYERFDDGRLMLRSALKDAPRVSEQKGGKGHGPNMDEIENWLKKVVRNIDEQGDELKRISAWPPVRSRPTKAPWRGAFPGRPRRGRKPDR